MDKGIYVSLLPKGKIKRTLTTESGEVELPETTIADEIILFSELDFEHYAQVVFCSEDEEGNALLRPHFHTKPYLQTGGARYEAPD